MTPGARVAAAIACLEQVLAGEPAEKVLTRWARASRFAGSGDRRAVRDHVFTAIRQKRSAAWLGGGENARAMLIGALRRAGVDTATLFTGEGHAPAPLSDAEAVTHVLDDAPRGVRLDWPDWLLPETDASLGDKADAIMARLRHRAEIGLRVNALQGDVEAAIASLAVDTVTVEPHPLSPMALRVTAGETRLRNAAAYTQGLVELQDAASQAVTDRIAVACAPATILDACAGGGGKSLALAAHFPTARITAHDANPGRMADLPARAERAGASIATTTGPSGTFDLVLCDVPCSGSGAWSRQPEAKWRLDQAGLTRLQDTQTAILDRFSTHVAPDGVLAYVTCSLFEAENAVPVDRFIARHPEWQVTASHRWTPLDGGDGFGLTFLTRK